MDFSGPKWHCYSLMYRGGATKFSYILPIIFSASLCFKAMFLTHGCVYTRVFLKGHFVKKKKFTPPRNWGAPRKNISRRRGWSNKSRGSLKALEVWQNSRRRPRQCFWMWKVLFLLPPSAVQAEDDGCSENLFSRETAGETLEWRWSYPLVLSAAHSPLQREENDAETP